ncbi:hypothetical protein K438DRAFT_1869684 [Mycena galopus ATCC 62051]|nr:hypothetical protein K438DRAFT_1869684 [Mycena galopus ATCC 62051]
MQATQYTNAGWAFLMRVFSETAASLVLYGVYINLFLLSVYTLARRRKNPGIKLLIAASCVIAVGGTTEMVVTIAQAVATARSFEAVLKGQASSQPHLSKSLLTAQAVIGIINNFVTDSLFLYRCYVIWGFQRKILTLPAFCMLSTLVVGIWKALGPDDDDPQIFCGLAAATNLILTTLTAGRLLWIRRAAASVGLDSTFRIRCNRAIGIILESGAIYCIAAIFLLITESDAREAYVIGLGFLSHLLNIIPTFSLVYVGLNTPVQQDWHPQCNLNTPSTRRNIPQIATTQLWQPQPMHLLDIKRQETDDEYV